MEGSSYGHANFWAQADALLRKNLTFQKRNMKANVRLILFPLVLCLLLVAIQNMVNKELEKAKNKCGCACIDRNGDGQCEEVCGLQYSTLDQASTCPVPSPPEWPPLLQVPGPEYRAVKTDFISFTDLPDEACRRTGSCPATIVFTGSNHSLAESLAGNLLASSTLNFSDILYSLSKNTIGSDTVTETTDFLESAII